ncbi:WD40 repeat domain-containing protein [Cellulomonas sp. SG140]|uniref:WD40 repeat domain-containing protein n=1 Tax=Cellulomonas sp. SG140 TaxID=2976536 RepID=UPI0021E73956|nr:WD40 repeat domain-containing protein [Cellulomonas sp. SG140]
MPSRDRPLPAAVHVSVEPLRPVEQLGLALVRLFYDPTDRPFSIQVDHLLSWREEQLFLQPLQAPAGLMPVSYGGVLDPAGRLVLAESLRTDSGAVLKPTAALEGASLRRIDLVSGAESRLGYARELGGPAALVPAPGPDGSSTAIAESVRRTTQDARGWAPTTLLSLAQGDARPQPVFELENTTLASRTDDLPLQWSPDGQRLALAAHDLDDVWPSVQILDLSSGVQMKHHDMILMGSMSWSPDGNLLLLASARNDIAHVLHVSSGRVEPLAAVPRPRPETGPGPRPYGFLTNDRLLIGSRRGGTLTASALHLGTGTVEPLLRWTAGPDPMPIFARHALSEWLSRTGRLRP